MPQLGADMTSGKLIVWHKKVGDRVERGQIIADVETDKADIEVEVFTTGVIEEILVPPGEKVPVGTVLAIIREDGKPSAVPGPAPVPAPSPAPWLRWRRPAPALAGSSIKPKPAGICDSITRTAPPPP